MIRGYALAVAVTLSLIAVLAGFLLLDDGVEVDVVTPATVSPFATHEGDAADLHDDDPSAVPAPIETDSFGEEDEALDAPTASRAVPRFVRVLDRRGRPVPGAAVRLVREGQARDRRRAAFSRSRERSPYRELTTGADGLAPLHPLPRRSFRIEACADGSFGAVAFELPRGGDAPTHVDLHLHPSPPVVVRVSHEDGTPCAGVRVEVHPEAGIKHRWDERLALWTDEQGTATGRITHEDEWVREGALLHATIRLVDGTRVTASPVAFAEGGYAFDLTVPPLVALTVDLVKPDGEPFDEAPVNLSWWRSTDSPDARRLGAVVAVKGIAVVGGLPPGETIHFRVTTRGREEVLTAIETNPAATPQRASITVGRLGATVVATLLTADGVPLPRHTFRIGVFHDDDRSRVAQKQSIDGLWKERRTSRTVRTTSQGTATIRVRAATAGRIHLFKARSRSRSRSKITAPEPDPVPDAVIRFPALEDSARHDAGSFAIPSYRVIAAGTVVDAAGETVPGVRVTASNGDSRADDAPPLTLGAATTGKDGSFIIFGSAPGPGDLSIAGKSRQGAVQATPLTLGNTALRLRLVRYGSITGTVNLSDPSVPIRLDTRIERVDGDKPVRVSASRARDGSLEARGIVPGMYRIRVWAAGIVEADLTGVHVAEGETVEPAGLADLRVGGSFRTGEIFVRDVNGRPIPKVRISVRERNVDPAARDQSASTDDRGHARIAYRSGVEFDVTVSLTGFRKRYRNPTFPLNVRVGALDAGDAARRRNRRVNDTPPLVITFDKALPRDRRVRSYTLILEPPGGAPKKPEPGQPKRERARVRSRPHRAVLKRIARGAYDVDLEISLPAATPGGKSRRVRVPLERIRVRGIVGERMELRVHLPTIEHAIRNVR